MKARKKLGRKDIVVIIDESKFGSVKYHKGRKVDGVWGFGLVERTPERKNILIQVESRKKEIRECLMQRFGNPEFIIHSDCKSYNNLCNVFEKHFKVKPSQNFVDPATGAYTNTMEGNFVGSKAKIAPVFRTKKVTELYLVRYTMRINHKKKMFEVVLNKLFN